MYSAPTTLWSVTVISFLNNNNNTNNNLRVLVLKHRYKGSNDCVLNDATASQLNSESNFVQIRIITETYSTPIETWRLISK